MSTPLWTMGLVVLGTLIGAFAPILLKKGSQNFKIHWNLIKNVEHFKNWRLMTGGALYMLSTIPFLIAIKYGELSVLYPLVSLGYVWVCLLSAKFLGEKVGIKWYGIILIIAGITLIGFSVGR